MKRGKAVALVGVVIIGLIFVSQRILFSPCDRPIHYRIDTVDSKFHLSKDKFTATAQKAADIWNKAYGKNLFVFDPEGDLSINLIYDERQLLNSQINNLEGQINSERGALDPQIAQYKKEETSFKARLDDLNSRIEAWNQKGGAPPDVYAQLVQEQKDLQAEADRLNAVAKSLNLAAQSYNVQVGNLNKKVDTFNASLIERPEEGIYIGDQNRIEIYFNITQNELIHTVAHEMGHARGLEHTINPKSVMYSKTNQILVPAKEDLDELSAVCAKRSLFDVVVLKVRAGRLD